MDEGTSKSPDNADASETEACKQIMDEDTSKSSDNADAYKSEPSKHSKDVDECGKPILQIDVEEINKPLQYSLDDLPEILDDIDDDGNLKEGQEVEEIHSDHERHSPEENERSEQEASIRSQQEMPEESMERLVHTENTTRASADSELPPQRISGKRLQQEAGDETDEPCKKKEKKEVGSSKRKKRKQKFRSLSEFYK